MWPCFKSHVDLLWSLASDVRHFPVRRILVSHVSVLNVQRRRLKLCRLVKRTMHLYHSRLKHWCSFSFAFKGFLIQNCLHLYSLLRCGIFTLVIMATIQGDTSLLMSCCAILRICRNIIKNKIKIIFSPPYFFARPQLEARELGFSLSDLRRFSVITALHLWQ